LKFFYCHGRQQNKKLFNATTTFAPQILRDWICNHFVVDFEREKKALKAGQQIFFAPFLAHAEETFQEKL
jgi:hypothetical protein